MLQASFAPTMARSLQALIGSQIDCTTGISLLGNRWHFLVQSIASWIWTEWKLDIESWASKAFWVFLAQHFLEFDGYAAWGRRVFMHIELDAFMAA